MTSITDFRQKLREEKEKASKYIKMKNGESKILHFSNNYEYVERESSFKEGEKSRKAEFEVTDPDTQQTKTFSANFATAENICDEIERGHTKLRIKRNGEGPKTTYNVSGVS